MGAYPGGRPHPMPDPTRGRHPTVSEIAPEQRRRWPRVLAGIAAGGVLATSLAGVGLQAVYGRLEGNITAVDISDVIGREQPAQSLRTDDGDYAPLTILLMGSDSRQGERSNRYGDPDVFTGERSDTTILLHIGADRSFATAVSIPRDTWVTVPECPRTGSGEMAGGFESKFNTAFEVGGPGCTVKLVEQITGLQIDHFAVIDFTGFKNVVDAMGGVEVCLTEAVDDQDSKLRLPAGTSVVTGEQALAFVRARKTLGDGSDLGRIQRQQAFLSSMIREASSAQLLLNPVRLFQVLDAATSSLTSDPGLADLDTLRDTALSMRGIAPGDITFLTMPWVARGDGANVLVDEEAAAPIWASIAQDVPWLKPKREPRGVLVDVAPADITVEVLNGSGIPGRATEAAEALEAAGFTVSRVADADRSDYATTEIRHDAASIDAARTVLAALAGSTGVADPAAATITIVIGADYTGVTKVRTQETGGGEDLGEDNPITAPTTADRVRCS